MIIGFIGGSEAAPKVFINPQIIWSSEEVDIRRGLPVHPGHPRGRRAARASEGRVLFIDHISKLKRDRIVKKFTKAAKRAEKEG